MCQSARMVTEWCRGMAAAKLINVVAGARDDVYAISDAQAAVLATETSRHFSPSIFSLLPLVGLNWERHKQAMAT